MQLILLRTERPSPGNKKRRDPLLDNRAVKKYRQIVHLQANYIQREMIADVVEDSPRGLWIWEATLIEHLAHGWNPKDVLRMLETYKLQAPEWRAGVS